MDPNQLADVQLRLAEQQLHAAWISAGAAVVQAVGALAAIWFSLKIARDAAARERAAEAAATARAEAAEWAAAQRERQADAAEFNRPLDAVVGMLRPALRELEEGVEKIRADYSEHRGSITGGLETPSLQKVRAAVANAEQRVTDPDVLVGLVEVAQLLEPWKAQSLPGPEYVKGAEALLARVQEAAALVHRLRKT